MTNPQDIREEIAEEDAGVAETSNIGELQAAEGYACSCGFFEADIGKFRGHLLNFNRREGKGSHVSRGRVNKDTGEVVMPPEKDRTPDQLKESRLARRPDMPGGRPDKSTKGTVRQKAATTQLTETLATAQQIRFVPRVYTIDYSPIMRAAQDAAIHFWGWRQDMPLGNFLDTILHAFFKEKGITLAGYIVEETPEQREIREKEIKRRNGGE